MNWLKDKLLLILTALTGIFAAISIHLGHKAKRTKEKLETSQKARKAEKEAVKAINEETKKRQEKANEIQSDNYDPRKFFDRYNR